MAATERRFGLGVLALALILGTFVMSHSMRLQRRESATEPELDSDATIPRKGVTQLRLGVIIDKTEYRLGEEIIAECVVINDSPYPVKTRPPVNMGATSYSRADPDDKLGHSVSITWAESEIEIPPNSTVVLHRFRFRCDVKGEFVIDIHGFPETVVLVGIPHAWILGGKTGGGSGFRHEVNMSDLNQFPHLIEAFEEDARAVAVHADHATYCPAFEAIAIIEFFGEEYLTSLRHYGYKLTAEDGSFYSFSIMFSWEPPIVE
jgi:hypothetical protein